MKHADITERIIGCAYKIYNKMGYGYLESVYKKCLLIELRKIGYKAEAEKPITVYYQGEAVGEFQADILVEDEIIVELKSVRQLAKTHEVQVVNYLVATGREIGLLSNFSENGVEIRRKVRDLHRFDDN